ncbi:MAG: hypothetical protein JKY80_08795 [Mariprofundaceae bacterium]|nr:hypothetical protein [Mariprofundaceae bacterium]
MLFALGLDQHEQVTKAALLQYETCQAYFPTILQPMSKEHAAIVIAANRDIDRMSWLHIGRSLSRLWHWHFYDAALYDADEPHIGIKPNFIGMERSLHGSFDKKLSRIKQLEHPKGKKFSILTGEILHFIQDMGVPAHVVPIYHDSFHPDKFDRYVVYGMPKYIDMKKSVCSDLLKANKTPEKQLNALAEDTRQAIAKHIPYSSETWLIFWNLPARDTPSSGSFHHYGMCGNVFGETKEALQSLPTACQLESDVFNNFYLDRYQKMVGASLRILLFLNRKQSH